MSGSEVERRHIADRRVPLDVPPRGVKPKKATGKKAQRRYSCAIGLRELMGLLAVLGPLGTFVSLWVLPESGPAGMNVHLQRRAPLERARVIHLTLAGNERKARFVLARDVNWEDFLGGVQERLQLGGINRIETSAGEAIMSVEDLMHDDHLIIYSDATLSAHGRRGLLHDGLPTDAELPAPIGPAAAGPSGHPLTDGGAPALPEPLQLLRRRAAARSASASVHDDGDLEAEDRKSVV